jgi:hypothetical protein
MPDFARDEIGDALDDAPELDADGVVDEDDLATPGDPEAFISRDDSVPAPDHDRRPAEVKSVRDDGSDTDSDGETAVATCAPHTGFSRSRSTNGSTDC